MAAREVAKGLRKWRLEGLWFKEGLGLGLGLEVEEKVVERLVVKRVAMGLLGLD